MNSSKTNFLVNWTVLQPLFSLPYSQCTSILLLKWDLARVHIDFTKGSKPSRRIDLQNDDSCYWWHWNIWSSPVHQIQESGTTHPKTFTLSVQSTPGIVMAPTLHLGPSAWTEPCYVYTPQVHRRFGACAPRHFITPCRKSRKPWD